MRATAAGYTPPRPAPTGGPISPDPEYRPAPPPTAWWRPVVLAISCLVIGFVAGYMIADDDGPATVVAQSTTPTEAETPTETAPAGTTVTAEEEPPPPEPEAVAVAVLNGTSVTGLAASTADRLAGLGYDDVATGNAPAVSGPSTVYYRDGAQAAAERLAEDAGAAGGAAALPASGELADAVPADAQVALVLGPG